MPHGRRETSCMVATRGRLDARGLRLACTAIDVELDGRDGGS
eukprot:CAMPEP_0183538128 /NCGR_PEP_ID=MMETSP0371-20130417/29377_1 /TAXON_ID=268820 /ORGANISM="Peridinium aciculiferum, Strain PAER-2" /LENGTH=41 /DNA_ID= /DNA_START= /DNA_END= /DNA_ORIENTATION=